MNPRSIVFFVVFMALLFSQSQCQQLASVWSSNPVFRVPESVYYDAKNHTLYVSNINGKPTEKNGKGFISRVSPKGKILALKWITGLDAPKGMAVFNDKLYVSDIDRLRIISIKQGKIEKTIPAPKAHFLNDVAVDEQGMVYVSDMSSKSSAIYRYDGKELRPWLTGKEIKNPNGLCFYRGTLYVGNSGDGTIKSVNIRTKEIKVIARVGHGIDGLIRLGNGDFVISHWQGKTEYVKKNGKMVTLLDTGAQKMNAADLGFIPAQSLILVPTFFDHRVVAYRLKQ